MEDGRTSIEGILTLPRKWCARFVRTRAEAQLITGLSRVAIGLDALLERRRTELLRFTALNELLRRLEDARSSRADASAQWEWCNAALPVALQARRDSKRSAASLCTMFAHLVTRLRAGQTQLRQWAAVNLSVAADLDDQPIALQKRIVADAEIQLSQQIERLCEQWPRDGNCSQPNMGDLALDSHHWDGFVHSLTNGFTTTKRRRAEQLDASDSADEPFAQRRRSGGPQLQSSVSASSVSASSSDTIAEHDKTPLQPSTSGSTTTENSARSATSTNSSVVPTPNMDRT
jgi:hypothetical protein